MGNTETSWGARVSQRRRGKAPRPREPPVPRPRGERQGPARRHLPKSSGWGPPLHTPLRPCSLTPPQRAGQELGWPFQGRLLPTSFGKGARKYETRAGCREQEFCKWHHLYVWPGNRRVTTPPHPSPSSRSGCCTRTVSAHGCTATFPSPGAARGGWSWGLVVEGADRPRALSGTN